MVKTKLGFNLNKPGNNINLNKPSNNINLNKPDNINLNKPTQGLRDKDSEPGNLRIPGFREPPGGMEPINNTGFYRTPSEPADPQDCERYPDSPWCGGNPFTLTPFGFEPSIVLTPCDIGIRFDGSFGFIRMPPVGLTYRNPNCRQPDPPLPNTPERQSPNSTFTPYPEPTEENRLYEVITKTTYDSSVRDGTVEIESFTRVWGRIYGLYKNVRIEPTTGDVYVSFYIVCKAASVAPDLAYTLPADLTSYFGFEHRQRYQPWYLAEDDLRFTPDNTARYRCIDCEAPPGNQVTYVMAEGNGGAVYHSFLNPKAEIISVVRTDRSCPIINYAPPLPPEPPMLCCPDDLIRLLIQKVDRLSEVVGIDEYPATVPDSFINRRGGFLGQIQPPNNIQVPSLTKLFEWYVKRFDELMGEWEIPIEIKDSDPTTPGDQNLGFALPNLAEAIAEMMLLLLQVNINSETLVNMNTRTMIEVGQDKQQNFKSYMMTSAIADYLGFKYEEKSHKLPMLFDIGKEDYDQLLKETEVNVVAPEFDGKQNFQEALHRLLEGAAITKAANFRKLKNNDQMKEQIVALLKGYAKTKKAVNNTVEDFDQFTQNAEVGFTNESGITDTTRPYGRDYSERPRIREIGNTSETES